MKQNQSERFRHIREAEMKQSRRRASQIETMIAEFDRMCVDLGHQIEAEERRAQIDDPAHFAYPTFAKSARLRRAKIQQSANALKDELERLSAHQEAA